MKKLLTLLFLLSISFFNSQQAFSQDSCGVVVWQDSIALPDSIVLIASATGTPPFTYEWSTGETSEYIFVWDTIEYCVTMTDANGCIASDCITAYYNDPGCWNYINAVNNGTGVVYNAVAGGSPPFQYFWSTGETTASITPDQAGNYCVYTIDGVGCVTNEYCIYFAGGSQDSCSTQVWANTTGTNASLYANSSGPWPYAYLWSTGSTAGYIDVTADGTYCVTVVDANGCAATDCYAHYPVDPDSCFASINALPSPVAGETLCAYSTGPGPYTYLWSTGETTFLINVVDEGDYCVTVVDDNGCSASTCYYYPGVIINDSCSVTFTAQADSFGILITAVPTGTGPFTYLWSPFGFTTPGIYVSNAGTYCVTIEDANGCIATACYFYSGTPDPDSCYAYINALPSPIAGEDLCAYSSGPGPYTYLWSTGETNWLINVVDEGTYCVTVIDGNGCEASSCYYYPGVIINDSCSVTFTTQVDSLAGILITASPTGTPPFTYFWSPFGFTTPSIYTWDAGTFCVEITDANGCVATACYFYSGPPNQDSCSVVITGDSLGLYNGVISAWGSGVAPYQYLWSTGETTESIQVLVEGTYCVTLTDELGCQASNCTYAYPANNNDSCSVYIYEDTLGTTAVLIADASANGPGPFTYVWSTGETTQQINVTSSGQYCVTLTNGIGCTATDCYYYVDNNLNYICGAVILPDSSQLMGSTTVSLYLLENGGTTLVDEEYFAGESTIWFYNFTNLADGDYIVKATIDAGATAAADHVPTYHYSEVLWEDADVITIPLSNSYCHGTIIMQPDGNIVGSGSGSVAGNVNDLYGALAGVTILLYDEQGNLIDHVTTNANGEYFFKDLPLGTYQIVIEYTGYNHASYWVTLTQDTPRVLDLDFEVNSDKITTGVFELAHSSSLKIYPNPVTDLMMIQLDDSWGSEVTIKVVNLEGKVLEILNQSASNHVIQVSANDWIPGMYFYQIHDERQMATGKIVKQ